MRACVRMSRRWSEAIRSEAKKCFFLASVDLDVITDSPLTRLAIAPAVTKVSCFNRGRRGRTRLKCTLTQGGQRFSGVNVVWGCFPGGGDSILSVLSWEPLWANLQDYQQLSLASSCRLTKSHDHPGCACALWCFCYDTTWMVIDAANTQGVSEWIHVLINWK